VPKFLLIVPRGLPLLCAFAFACVMAAAALLGRRGLGQFWRRAPALRHQPAFFCSAAASSAEDDAAQRMELAKRAHKEVQVARRRRREADDETVLFKCANAAGYFSCEDDGDELQRRRRTIDRFLSARAEELMDAIAAGRPLSEIMDFTVEVAPSRDLPQPIAGNGVFIKSAANGEVPAGSLVAFYPGSVYMPHEVRWLGGDGPMLERAGQPTSSHVIARVGGVMIDGLWSQIEVPASEFDIDDAELSEVVADRLRKEDVQSDAGRQAAREDMEAYRSGLRSDRRSCHATVSAPDHGGVPQRIRSQNPLAVGEMINHPPDGRPANVLGWPIDLNLFDKGDNWAAYARVSPNAYALRPQGAPGPGAPCPYTVVMVTAHALKPGEELYMDYGCELLELEDIPVWFSPASLRGDAKETDAREAPALAIRDELHAWRVSFEEVHGRRPSRHDLLSDPVSSALFETFQKYRKLGDL